ncbi:hypothetical protein B5X24_HaOG202230 [Helicoverpa armigera]|uniref:Uncharacterized protein n=1 Tax=Helicoverpa armigera TaxID=29058 RepID=A0A2W1BYU0_HELAM|nr:hypothetical protein B5X24_HaOG202230 [Helicoverpa armigera]
MNIILSGTLLAAPVHHETMDYHNFASKFNFYSSFVRQIYSENFWGSTCELIISYRDWASPAAQAHYWNIPHLGE